MQALLQPRQNQQVTALPTSNVDLGIEDGASLLRVPVALPTYARSAQGTTGLMGVQASLQMSLARSRNAAQLPLQATGVSAANPVVCDHGALVLELL